MRIFTGWDARVYHGHVHDGPVLYRGPPVHAVVVREAQPGVARDGHGHSGHRGDGDASQPTAGFF